MINVRKDSNHFEPNELHIRKIDTERENRVLKKKVAEQEGVIQGLQAIDRTVLQTVGKLFQAEEDAQTKAAFYDARLGLDESTRSEELLQRYTVGVEQALKEFRVMTGKLLSVLPYSGIEEVVSPVGSPTLLADLPTTSAPKEHIRVVTSRAEVPPEVPSRPENIGIAVLGGGSEGQGGTNPEVLPS